MAFSCKTSSDKNTCIAVCYESCSYNIHILCDCEHRAGTAIARDVFKTKPKYYLQKGLYGFNLLKTGILVVCVLAGEDAVTTCVSPRQTAGRPGPRLESGSGKLKAANLGGGSR